MAAAAEGAVPGLSWLLGDRLSLVVISIICTAIVLTVLYRAALPRLLPGVPHHPDTGKSIWGDVPRLIEHSKTSGGEILDWMMYQGIEYNSRVYQLALKPLNRPFIVVDDLATTEDILSRRGKEFDRGQETADFFDILIPQSTVVMKSHDRFRTQRRLWSGIMSNSFLHNTTAPHLLTVFNKLVDLWRLKAQLAAGHPFEASADIKLSTLDAIWTLTHGNELGSLQTQLDLMQSTSSLALPDDIDKAAQFPYGPLPPLAKSVQRLINAVKTNNPFPRLYRAYMYCVPSFWTCWRIKERSVETLLGAARKKFSSDNNVENQEITCAMDHVVMKEVAEQEKRGTFLIDRAMKDETFMILLAGHETTSTTIQWAMKFLADNQEDQQRLHQELVSAFPSRTDGHFFTAAQIVQEDLPFLDAVVHETLRISRTAGAVVREAMCDTQILGYPVPKGTMCFLSLSGDSYFWDDTIKSPDMPEDVKRPERAKTWQKANKRQFDPARWLTRVDGKDVFDPNAGPSLPFSAGTRGCFGKKLALLELRIIIASIARSFHLQKLPESLNSYKAWEVITRMPLQCYINPREAD